MSKITAIESAIVQLGAGEFQKICDTFLSKMDKYGAILGLGMKTGTLKTTIGNPDTYFRRENGKYVFVAYTTQQDNIFSKLKDDVEKCLDVGKTGVALIDIEEIVCCHASSKLSAGDDQKLHEMCSDYGIALTIYGVDEIAQQIYRNYPTIARDFLGISIDTNQIMSVDDFVNLYDASETAAPLDTVFQNRAEELSKLQADIRANNVVIVHGAAGVGKTRLVLEAVRTVAQEDGYNLLCVKNNNLQLYDDLVSNTEKPGNYLFFVDDANELAGLNLILEYITKVNLGYKIRIIMTVRDYAKESVIRDAWRIVTPCLYELKAFTEEEIKDFLKINMQITNEQFVDPIIEISAGNPRVAYMAGKVAKDTQSLAAVHDATQVYEQYYASIVESRLGDNRNLCLTAGILALVKAVMLDSLDYLDPVLNIGNLTREEFIDCIRQLSSMEVVEIQKDKVAAISDQCFANYMLYYEFFARKRVPFSELLSVGFIHFREGVIHSINTLMNLFFKSELQSYIETEVGKIWDKFKNDNTECFEEFARIFHVFRPEEAFIIAADKIDKIPQEISSNKHIDFEKGTFKSGDDILGFITGYEYTNYFETALEVLMSYVQKSDDNAIIGFSWLKSDCGLNSDSYRYNYHSEKVIAKKLAEYTSENNLIQRFILAYISYALAFEFRPTEMGRGNTLKIYDIKIKNCSGVKEYRAECWKLLKVLSVNNQLQDETINLLKKYAASVRAAEDASIVSDDKEYVLDILSGLNCSALNKGLIVRDLYYGWEKSNIDFDVEDEIFQSTKWKLYVLLEDEWIYSGLEYEVYQRQREESMIKYAENLSKSQISEFITAVASIVSEMDIQSKYSIIQGAETVIRKLCEDSDSAWTVFESILSGGIDIGLYPDIVLQAVFRNYDYHAIWNLLEGCNSANGNIWQLSFFQNLPEEYINKNTYEWLTSFLKSNSDKGIQTSSYRNLRFLDKFIKIDSDVYVTASRIIFNKVTYNEFIARIYLANLFNESVFSPEEILTRFASDQTLLKNIYFFTLRSDHFADYNNRFLVAFMEIDDSWVDEYADFIDERIQKHDDQDYDQYVALWKADGYMRYFDRIFDKVSENFNPIFSWRIATVFKVILAHEHGEQEVCDRQNKWVLHIIDKYAKDERIICLFAALSESGTSLRKSAFQRFFQLNDSYDMFQQLQLDPNHWGGFESEMVFDLQNKIEFLESILPYASGIKYLKHAKRIRDRIEFWKAQIEQTEMESICRKLH